MSFVTASDGSARSSSHVQPTDSAPPSIVNVHSSSGVCGVGPADSTGKSSVTYWPGGTRPPAPSFRLPRNPRDTYDIATTSPRSALPRERSRGDRRTLRGDSAQLALFGDHDAVDRRAIGPRDLPEREVHAGLVDPHRLGGQDEIAAEPALVEPDDHVLALGHRTRRRELRAVRTQVDRGAAVELTAGVLEDDRDRDRDAHSAHALGGLRLLLEAEPHELALGRRRDALEPHCREPGSVRGPVAPDHPAPRRHVEVRLAASQDDLDEVLLGRRLAPGEQDAAGGQVDRLAAELIPRLAAGIQPANHRGHGNVDAKKGALIFAHARVIAPQRGNNITRLGDRRDTTTGGRWPGGTLRLARDRAHRHPGIREDPPMRDPRYDVLFEPVQLGPVTARNRFFQVPHCNGMGHHHPTAHAHMRGVKAEGGWAVVCTEEVEIHPTSEVSPYIEGRLWDDSDIPALRRMTEKIHEHGSL